jgi:hypothetical protein
MSELPPSPPSSSAPENSVSTPAPATSSESEPVLAHDPLAQHPAPETHSPAASVQPPAAATSKAGTEAIETKSVEPSAPPVPSWGARLREGLDGKEFNLKLIVGLLAFCWACSGGARVTTLAICVANWLSACSRATT